MAIDVEESSFLEYTQMWIKRGLFEVFMQLYRSFKAVEEQTYFPLIYANLMMQRLVLSIKSEEDIQILWSTHH